MKYLTLPAVIAVLVGLSGVTASAQSMVKIGTVDMKKVFENYYKTKDAEQRINEARNSAKKELEERMESYQKGAAEVKKLNEEIDSPALSNEAKGANSKARDEKVAELNNMQREIQEFRTTREKQLQEQSGRMRQGIVDDITKIVTERVKAENYDLVFDKSGMSLNGVPVVMFAKDPYDFTDVVVAALNKNKGKDEPAAAAPPAAATPAAKPEKPEATPKKKTN
jgi:outer membrane protein